MYIGRVGDIGPIGANGNMGALCPMGTIGPNRTQITNWTNIPIGLRQQAQNHYKYNGFEGPMLRIFTNAMVLAIEGSDVL